MKVEAIMVSEVEDYLNFVRLERETQVLLTEIQKHQEQINKIIERVTDTATIMRSIKLKHNFKTDKEMIALIKKYARVGC